MLYKFLFIILLLLFIQSNPCFVMCLGYLSSWASQLYIPTWGVVVGMWWASEIQSLLISVMMMNVSTPSAYWGVIIICTKSY